MNEIKKVHFNSFAKRQIKESTFTFWEELTYNDICNITFSSAVRDNLTEGYRKGVIVVRLFADYNQYFKSRIGILKEGDELMGIFSSRVDGEAPRKSAFMKKVSTPEESYSASKKVEVILYSSEVLAEDGNNEMPANEGNYEIVAINAFPTFEDTPIDTYTAIYNHFHEHDTNDGGTSDNLSAHEFEELLRKSHLYWKDKCVLYYDFH